MKLNITIDSGCNDIVKANAEQWINEAAIWSAEQYGKVDLQAGTTWNVEPYEFSAVSMQPQFRPLKIRMSEIDICQWTPEIQKREWFTAQLYYVGFEIGIKSAAIGIMRSAKYTLARDIDDEAYRAGWNVDVEPYEEKLLWLKQFHPELIKSWTDRSGWLSDHVSKLSPTHWTFPATNPKLCRLTGPAGSGAIYPEGSGRK